MTKTHMPKLAMIALAGSIAIPAMAQTVTPAQKQAIIAESQAQHQRQAERDVQFNQHRKNYYADLARARQTNNTAELARLAKVQADDEAHLAKLHAREAEDRAHVGRAYNLRTKP